MAMRLRWRLFISLCGTLLVIFGGLLGGGASAATTATSVGGNGNGYKISPVRTDLIADVGTSQTVPVYIQNVSSAAEDLQVLIDDFQANSDESGDPDILLNGASAPHGLKQFITVPTPTFTLQPGQQKEIDVVVTIPAKAAAGGYYAVFRIAPATVGGGKNVTLAASVGSLILVTVPGNIKEQVGIVGFSVQSGGKNRTILTSGKSLDAVVRFENSGDVQEQPFGKIVLKKYGKQIGLYSVNTAEPPGNVLPDSIRKFSVPLTNVSSIGKYTIQGNFGYGSNGQLISATSTFYIIPVFAILSVIIVIAIILVAIFEMPRLIRSYNRRIIRRAGRRQ